MPGNEGIRITFGVQSQVKNDHFDVLWSTDGRNWKKVGTIAGAGTTNQPMEYEFSHEYPRRGNNYYKIRQVDENVNTDSFDANHPNNPKNAKMYSEQVVQHFD